MSEASIASAHGYITVSGVVLIVGLLLIRAAQEALSLLKANEPQIKQLHAKLEDES